jgi:hypothetical protein
MMGLYACLELVEDVYSDDRDRGEEEVVVWLCVGGRNLTGRRSVEDGRDFPHGAGECAPFAPTPGLTPLRTMVGK